MKDGPGYGKITVELVRIRMPVTRRIRGKSLSQWELQLLTG
jgi:hypothetical protein